MTSVRRHPLAVSRTARFADRAIAAVWRAGLDAKPPLEPEYLWRIGGRGFSEADERGGRDEKGVADFRQRLDELCGSLRQEAALNALGHTMAYGQLTGAIRKRHALGRLWRERPRLADTALAPPIIVVGQMRAGTTRIHRLLAADPAHAATRFCNSVDPLPKGVDIRPIKAALALAIARRINPWLDTLHPFGATRPDEELGWLSLALSPCAYEAQWHIPAFVAWSEGRNPAPVYREFARVLRTDAETMRDTNRPRIMKCPQFAEDLATLLDTFPDARLIVARREPAPVLESSVSMVAGQSAFQSNARSLRAIRQEWQRKLALREARMAAALARHRGPVAIVEYRSLDADWKGAVADIYEALGLKLTAATMAAMASEQHASARSPHRAHAAALDRFGRHEGDPPGRPMPGITEPTRLR